MQKREISRKDREKYHKWGKARKIIDENRIKTLVRGDDLCIYNVSGDNDTYRVGLDVETGQTFCGCPFVGQICSHQIAAHLKLSRIGVENE